MLSAYLRALLKHEFNNDTDLRTLMLRNTQALITQMAQTAVCNRHHSIDQQLCRWLLLSMDRLPSNQLNMTQELIANMLGVRREGVSEAAGKLQKLGSDNISSRNDRGAGQAQTRRTMLRVLFGGQTGNRPPAILPSIISGQLRRQPGL